MPAGKKRTVEKVPRALLLFFAVSAFPIAGFLLMHQTDTQFYLSMLTLSLLVLIWMRHYYHDRDQLVDYDENPGFMGLVYVVAGVIGIRVLAGFLVAAANSVFYVPVHGMEMEFGRLQLSGFWSDVLFQVTLVAPSEEAIKLVTQLSMYLLLKPMLGIVIGKATAIFVPIGFWGIMHTYRNPAYQGSGMWWFVTAAVGGGIIIYAVMWQTKSLLAAILVHTGYNILVLYGFYFLGLV